MQYSPKLKKAMEEIKTILQREDIAAVVVLHDPGFSEYMVALQPSYSCVTEDGGQLGFKMDLKQFDNEADRQKKLTSTCNMMAHLSRITTQIGLYLNNASAKLDQVVDATHYPAGNTTHNEQNN